MSDLSAGRIEFGWWTVCLLELPIHFSGHLWRRFSAGLLFCVRWWMSYVGSRCLVWIMLNDSYWISNFFSDDWIFVVVWVLLVLFWQIPNNFCSWRCTFPGSWIILDFFPWFSCSPWSGENLHILRSVLGRQ